jgi:sec-independent protein translocase protein TatA
MFGLGLPEIIVILVIILIVFGVGRLPEIGSGLGKAIRGFKKGVSDSNDADPPSKQDGPNEPGS